MATEDLGTPPSPEHSLRFQAVAGVFWTAVQKWSVRLSTFVGFLLLGRLLAPKDFGVVALASVFIVLMSTLADSGFATYLVQTKELTEEAKSTAFYIAAGSGVLLFLASCALAWPLALLLDVPDLKLLLPALGASLVFVGLGSVPVALLTRELRFQTLAMRQVLATVLSVVAAVLLAVAGAGAWALVGQFLVLRFVNMAVLLVASDFRPRRGFDRSEARTMLAYSTKAMGAQLLYQLRDQGEVLLIGGIAGPVALGFWTVAGRLVSVVADLLGSVIGSVSVPLFARVQDDPKRLTRAVSAIAGIGTLVLAPALVLLALLSPELVPQVFGAHWKPATGVAALLAVRGIFLALTQLDRSVLIIAGRAGGELRLIAVLALLHLVVVAAFARHGVEPLAVVLLVETLLVAPVRPVLLHRWLGVPYRAYVSAVSVCVATGLSGGLALLAREALDATGILMYAVVVGVGLLTYPLLVVLLARPVLRETLATVKLFRGRGKAASEQLQEPVDDPR